MSTKLRTLLAALVVTIPLDLGTKIWVDASLTYSDRLPVVEGFFYITHVRNPGAAFSLFVDWPAAWRLGFFISVSLVAIGIILSFFRRLEPGDRLSALALGMILGGAIGNLVDRIFRGEVVDFLHFRLWSGYSWPDFNLADTFIVCGVGFLVLELFTTEGEDRARPTQAEPGR
jgi:signal peptidase II